MLGVRPEGPGLCNRVQSAHRLILASALAFSRRPRGPTQPHCAHTRTRAPPGPPGRTPPSPVTPPPSAEPRAACPQLQLGAHGRTQQRGVRHGRELPRVRHGRPRACGCIMTFWSGGHGTLGLDGTHGLQLAAAGRGCPPIRHACPLVDTSRALRPPRAPPRSLRRRPCGRCGRRFPQRPCRRCCSTGAGIAAPAHQHGPGRGHCHPQSPPARPPPHPCAPPRRQRHCAACGRALRARAGVAGMPRGARRTARGSRGRAGCGQADRGARACVCGRSAAEWGRGAGARRRVRKRE